MADISNNRFAQFVRTTTQLVTPLASTMRHVSEGFAKHLPYQHTFSTRKHPQDQSGGMMPSGDVFANDAYFMALERATTFAAKNGGALAYPLAAERVAMMEWPTASRIRGLRAFATEATTVVGAVAAYRDQYFSATPAAAFPAFALVAFDPNDVNFTPINLLLTADSANFRAGQAIPMWEALSFGVNRRSDPLIIAMIPTANVVANSGIALFAEFIKPHL